MTSPRKPQRWFRHTPLDAIHVSLLLSLSVGQLWLALSFAHLPGWGIAVAYGLLPALAFLTSKTQHLAVHTPFFYSPGANAAVRLLTSLCNRFPTTPYFHLHVITHHQVTIDYTPFSLRAVLGLGSNLRETLQVPLEALKYSLGIQWLGLLRRTATAMRDGVERPERPATLPTYGDYVEYGVQEYLYWLTTKRRALFRQHVADSLALSGYGLLLLLIDYRFFFFVYVPARWVGDTLLMLEEYCEHYGISGSDTLTNAVSSYGWINRLIFNAGYHQEHHRRPSTHWTLLPRVRAEMLPATQRRVLPFHYLSNVFVPLHPLQSRERPS